MSFSDRRLVRLETSSDEALPHPPASPRSDRRLLDTPWLGEFAALAAICLLALNSGLYNLFPPMGWVDPGLYIFNFLSLAQNFADYGANYHSTRIPFLFLGWLSYRGFEPVVAQQVLVNLVFLVGLGALLALARATLDHQLARMVFVLAFALSPIWVCCFAQGYVDGLAISFALLGIAAALSRRVGGPDLACGFAAGAAAGLSVATHPIPGMFASTAISLIFVTRATSWRQFTVALLGAFSGGVASLLAMAAASLWLGGPFLFLLPSAELGVRSFETAGSSFVLPHSAWLLEATRAVLAPLALALVAAGAAMRRRSKLAGRIDGFLFTGCAALLLLALAEYSQRGLLQFRFYASYLLLIIVPLVALLFGDRRSGEAASGRADIALAFALGLLQIPIWQLGKIASFQIVWALLLTCCLVATVSFASHRIRIGFGATILALSLAATTDGELANILDIDNPAKPRLQAQFAGRIRDAVVVAGVSNRRIVTWFNRDSFEKADTSNAVSTYRLAFAGTIYRFSLFDGATAGMGWNLTSLGFEMPKLEGALYRQLTAIAKRPTAAVLLCIDEAECRQGVLQLSLEPLLIVSERFATRIEIPGLPTVHLVIIELMSRQKANPAAG